MSLLTPKGIVPDTDIASPAKHGKAHAERLLQLVFGASYLDAHVAGILPAEIKLRHPWAGGRYRTEHAKIVAGSCCYFSQSLFTGSQRIWTEWDGLWCVVLDDVGSKVNAGAAKAALGMPAWCIESSPGNWQWGYLLEKPEKNKGLCDLLFAELGARGLCDPGAAKKTGSAIGYRRLPVGVNAKAPGHVVHGIIDPKAGTWTVPEMLKAIGVDDTAIANSKLQPAAATSTTSTISNTARVPVSPDSDPLYRMLSDLGVLSGEMSGDGEGYELTGCPWVEEHTGRLDTGRATYWPPGTALGGKGFGGFQCHHGHCEHRTVHDLRAWAVAQSGKSVAAEAFDPVAEDEASALDETEAVVGARKPLDVARDTGTRLAAGCVYVLAETSVIMPDGSMLSARAFNTAYRDELRPLLTRPGEKEAPILWLIRQAGVTRVHHIVHWYGREARFSDRGVPVWNTWRDHGRGLGVRADQAGMWLWLVRRLLGGHANSGELIRDFVHWLAVVVADPGRTPGWAVVLWSDTEGVGKDLVFMPIQLALDEDAGTVDVQRVLDGRYNPWSAKRFVHGREFSVNRLSRDHRAIVYNAFKRHVDNTQNWVEYSDKYVRSQRVPKRDCYAFTSNDADAIPLDPSARRAWVVKSLAGRLPADFAEDFVSWLDEDSGTDSVIAYLRAVREAMTENDVSRVTGPAPETGDRRAMIRAADPIYAAIEDEMSTMPDLVSLQDLPLSAVVEQARQLLGHVPQVVVEQHVTRALSKAGFQRVTEHQVRVPSGEKRRIWSKIDHAKYRAMPPILIGRTYWENRGKPGTNVVTLT